MNKTALRLKPRMETERRFFIPPEKPALEGRGIVTATSRRYWAGTYVLVKMLRHTGCELPIQVWYKKADGKPDISGVSFYPFPGIKDAKNGCAPFSKIVLDCGFKQVFRIGSDAYPVVDITPMFDDATVFWREIPNGCSYNPSVYGLSSSTGFTPQGDTLLIDLDKHWNEFSLAHHFNERLNYYGMFGWGDQTNYRAAWATYNTPMRSYSPNCVDWTSHPGVFIHQDRDGVSPGLVHRVHHKWGEGESYYDTLPLESIAWAYRREFDQ